MNSPETERQTISPDRMAEINGGITDRDGMFYWQVDRDVSMREMKTIFMDRHTATDPGAVLDQVQMLLPGIPGYEDAKVTRLTGDAGYKAGSVNYNRLVHLSDGRRLVAKVHPTGLVNGYFDVEAAAQQLARKVVPTPGVIAVSHMAERGGYDMELLIEMPGMNAHVYTLDHPEAIGTIAVDAGRMMARLHEVKVSGYGFFDNDLAARTGELRGIHDNYSKHLLASLEPNLEVLVGAKYISRAQADQMIRLLQSSAAIETDDPRLIQNDMAFWNLLTDGKNVTGVLDWDECHAGDPYADLACWSLFYSKEVFDSFLEGYSSVSPLKADFEEKFHVYRLRYIISKVGLRYRKLEIQKDDIMPILIKSGIEALEAELKYLGL